MSPQENTLDELARQIHSLRPRTLGEQFQDAASGFASGFTEIGAGLIDSIAIAGSAIDEFALDDPKSAQRTRDAGRRISDSLRDYVRAAVPASEKEERGFVDTLAQGIGSGVGFVGTGVVGRALRIPALLSTASTGAGVQAAQEFYEAKAHESTDEDAWKAYALGALVGSSEAVPISRVFARIDKSTNGGLRRALLHAATEGVEEGAQEVGQQAASNLIASHLVGFDEDRELLEGVVEGGAAGFLTGVLFSAVGSAVARRSEREQSFDLEDGAPAGAPAGGATDPEFEAILGEVDAEKQGEAIRALTPERRSEFERFVRSEEAATAPLSEAQNKDVANVSRGTSERKEVPLAIAKQDPGLDAALTAFAEGNAITAESFRVFAPGEGDVEAERLLSDLGAPVVFVDAGQPLARPAAVVGRESGDPVVVLDAQQPQEALQARVLHEAVHLAGEAEVAAWFERALPEAFQGFQQEYQARFGEELDPQALSEEGAAFAAESLPNLLADVMAREGALEEAIRADLGFVRGFLQKLADLLERVGIKIGSPVRAAVERWRDGLAQTGTERSLPAADALAIAETIRDAIKAASGQEATTLLQRAKRALESEAARERPTAPAGGEAEVASAPAITETRPTPSSPSPAGERAQRKTGAQAKRERQKRNKLEKRAREARERGDLEAAQRAERQIAKTAKPERGAVSRRGEPTAAASAIEAFEEGEDVRFAAAGPRLHAIHNLSEDNLLFADELGGLPAPSFAVTKAGDRVEGFGDITLIGRREMVDPKAGGSIFSADAWAPRFPTIRYKMASFEKASNLLEPLRESIESYGYSMGEFLSPLQGNQGIGADKKGEAVDFFESRRSPGRVVFLAETGSPIRKFTRKKRVGMVGVDSESFRTWLKSNPGVSLSSIEKGSAAYESLSRALEAGIREELSDVPEVIESVLEDTFGDDGLLFFGKTTALLRAIDALRNPIELDQSRIEDLARSRVREDDYREWYRGIVDQAFTDPWIQLGRRKAPLSLDNVRKAMLQEDPRGKEGSMAFGPGAVRGASSRKFSSIEEVRKASSLLGSVKELREFEEKIQSPLQEAFFREVTPFYKWDDSWGALDDAHKALAKNLNGVPLKRAFASTGFPSLSSNAVKAAEAYKRSIVEAPTEYFEAHTSGPVGLTDFAGAVIPRKAKRARKKLEELGIPFEVYAKDLGDGSLQSKAIRRMEGRLRSAGDDVRFASGQKQETQREQALRILRDVQREAAQAEREGETTDIGSLPSRIADTSKDPAARALQRGIREVRSESQETVEIAAQAEAAQQRFNSNPQAVTEEVLSKMERGEALSAEETLIADRIKTERGLDVLTKDDPQAYGDAVRAGWLYQDARRETGRALSVIRDSIGRLKTNKERLADLIALPSRSLRGKLEKLRDELRNIETSRGRKQQIRDEIDRLLRVEAKRVKKARKRLTDAGYPPQLIADNYFASPEDYARMARIVSTAKSTAKDVFIEYRLASMLGGPLTQIANITGNAAQHVYEQHVIRLSEAMANTVIGSDEAASLGEVRAFYRSWLPGLFQAARNMTRAYKTEMPVYELDLQRKGVATGEFGTKVDAITGQAIPGLFGRIIRLPSLTSLLAFDELFKTLSGWTETHALAFRAAKAEGLEGDALAARSAELIEDPTWDGHLRALHVAKKGTFQDKPGKFLAGISDLRAAADDLTPVPIGSITLPFINTPAKIFKAGLGIPAHPLISLYRLTSGRYKGDPKAVAEDTGRSIVSLAVMALILDMAFGQDDEDGLPVITGSASPSAGGRALDFRTAPAHSIRFGDTYYDYGRIEPAAVSIQTLVDLGNAYKTAQSKGEQGGTAAAARELFASIGRQMSDKTFLRTVGDVYRAVVESDRGNFLPRFTRDIMVTPMIPNVIRQPARAVDPAIRENTTRNYDDKGAWQASAESVLFHAWPTRSGRPEDGLFQAPPIRHDLWGRPITRAGNSFLVRLLSPAQPSQRVERVSDLDRIILRYNERVANGDFSGSGKEVSPWLPARPGYWFDEPGTGKKSYFTDAEYERLTREAGQLAAETLIGRGISIESPTPRDIDLMQKVVSQARRRIRNQIIRERRNQ